MSINELEAKARELMEVRKEIEELEAMKTAIEDAIKYEMAQQGAETLTAGDYKMTWKVVTGTRFDSTALMRVQEGEWRSSGIEMFQVWLSSSEDFERLR